MLTAVTQLENTPAGWCIILQERAEVWQQSCTCSVLTCQCCHPDSNRQGQLCNADCAGVLQSVADKGYAQLMGACFCDSFWSCKMGPAGQTEAALTFSSASACCASKATDSVPWHAEITKAPATLIAVMKDMKKKKKKITGFSQLSDHPQQGP